VTDNEDNKSDIESSPDFKRIKEKLKHKEIEFMDISLKNKGEFI
jgi:hypothetical protein